MHHHDPDLRYGVTGVREHSLRRFLAEVLARPDDHDPVLAEQRRAEGLDQVGRDHRGSLDVDDLGLGVDLPRRADDSPHGPGDQELLVTDDDGQWDEG
jgi:hypothetical protein